MKGDLKIESKVQKVIACKCHGWRTDAIPDGGGVTYAADSSNKTVTVNGDSEVSDFSISAGNSNSGDTSNNTANVSNTTSVTHILVGLTSVGNANYNIANIRNVSGVAFIDGGYA